VFSGFLCRVCGLINLEFMAVSLVFVLRIGPAFNFEPVVNFNFSIAIFLFYPWTRPVLRYIS